MRKKKKILENFLHAPYHRVNNHQYVVACITVRAHTQHTLCLYKNGDNDNENESVCETSTTTTTATHWFDRFYDRQTNNQWKCASN